MEPKPKNPKKVEQGNKLAARNKEKFEEWKRMKEERRRHEEEEEEGLTISRVGETPTLQGEEEEGLTTFKEEKKIGKKRSHTSTNLLILPASGRCLVVPSEV